MDYESFLKEVELKELRNGVWVQCSDGIVQVDGIIVDGDPEAGCDYEGAFDEMESQTGVFVIDIDDDSVSFVDHYSIDCVHYDRSNLVMENSGG